MMEEPRFRWKQCLVLRQDLKMTCGKTCAQAAHAAVMAFERADPTTRRRWTEEGQKKVVLKVPGEQALYELREIAIRAGIPCALVQDAGLTEVPPGTVTALGLGPAENETIDRITGGLPLL